MVEGLGFKISFAKQSPVKQHMPSSEKHTHPPIKSLNITQINSISFILVNRS